MVTAFPPIFDGHNDTVQDIAEGRRSFFERSTPDINDFKGGLGGNIDLPRAREGGLGGGFFAVYQGDPASSVVRPDMSQLPTELEPKLMKLLEPYNDTALYPEPMPLAYAQSEALRQLGTLFKIEAESNGEVKIVRTAAELQECLDTGVFAIEMHFEGAPPLDPSGDALEVFHAAGLRSVGLVHSRRNRFAEGVPIATMASPDTGPGLTDAGKELIRQLNRKKMVIDMAHLNEKGFWDVAEITDAPLVSTHTCAWAIANMTRNLTDRQLDAVKDSNGVVGLNFHVAFLRPDGRVVVDTPLSLMADHVEYMVDRMGINCVALGSDFDGAVIPGDLADAAGLPLLMQEIKDRGYNDEEMTKIAHGNWVRLFRETWGE